MQIHVVDLSFGLERIRFVTKLFFNHLPPGPFFLSSLTITIITVGGKNKKRNVFFPVGFRNYVDMGLFSDPNMGTKSGRRRNVIYFAAHYVANGHIGTRSVQKMYFSCAELLQV